jgi:hypothetical protein
MMALGIYFSSKNFTPALYDQAIVQLAAAGASAPSGRASHVAFANGETLDIFDVWDSMESFEAFGQTLMPILAGLGVDPGQPHIAEVHNIIEG